jgi:hypothetical protein
MSASEMPETAAEPAPAPSPLKTFLVKLAAVTCAALVFFYLAFSLVTGFIEEKADQLAILKGGPAFWGEIEGKLDKLASAPDLPPEKKEKIVNSLRTLSVRYKPYIDAISGDVKGPQQQR